MIEIKNIIKDYGDGKGVFDVSLNVAQGEVIGLVGTNGAGKTTLIRHLMGFLKSDKGRVKINNMDCWSNSSEVKKLVGYIPGEIAFPDYKTGTDFLNAQAKLLGLKDMSYAESIIKKLQLDPTATLKRMSKGMKQKTAIVAALMSDPEILILDEPTTGLDPLMRSEFVKILLEEKKKGKTIFMSSHMFEEVEETCDRVVLIKEGKIIGEKNTNEIKHNQNKEFKIGFDLIEDFTKFANKEQTVYTISSVKEEQKQIVVVVNDANINNFTKELVNYNLKYINEIKFTLDKYFKDLN